MVPKLPDSPLAAEALTRALPPSAPNRALRDRITASLGRGGRFGAFADRLARLFRLPLEEGVLLAERIEEGSGFFSLFGEGVEVMGVRPGRGDGTSIGAILRLQPGARFPRHVHPGGECTLVLAGGFRDDRGVEVVRGDEHFEPAGSLHELHVLDDEVCVVAVVVTS